MKQRALSRSVGLMILLVWAGGVVRAQNTPFKNPSLDSNCYFPQIGDPNEMHTIYGSVGLQDLGWIVKNLGPKPNGGYGNLLIGNLTPPPDQNTYTLSQVATGPGFNLHQMTQSVQNLSVDDLTWISNGFTLGHFRDRQHLDLFDGGRIYWSSDAGNFDSNRYTVLNDHISRGDFKPNGGVGGGPILPWYVTHLTSDTVDDIVLSAYSAYTDGHDTAYVTLYRGGSRLYGKDTIFEDTSALLYPMTPNSASFRQCTQADFRGVGRDDLIVSDRADNFCYFKNNPPFSLQQFARAVALDTIFAVWQNPGFSMPYGLHTWFTMRALPKARGDRSVDFMPVLVIQDSSSYTHNIFIFRGGPDFGSHRITLDSAAFIIHQPKLFVGDNWPEGLVDVGDMTGTGNKVLNLGADDGVARSWDLFYVTGKALDEKIDMFIVGDAGAYGDTLTANGDSLEDLLEGLPGEINPQGTLRSGALRLLYGSKQIPVHLNSQWADVKTEIDAVPKRDGAGIIFAPNPVVNSWSVATIVWPEAEEAEYKVYDMLGIMVERGPLRMLGGAEQQRVYFSGLVPGTYLYTLTGSRHTASTRFVKLSASGAPAGPSSPNFMQSLRDARDGRMAPSATAPSLIR